MYPHFGGVGLEPSQPRAHSFIALVFCISSVSIQGAAQFYLQKAIYLFHFGEYF